MFIVRASEVLQEPNLRIIWRCKDDGAWTQVSTERGRADIGRIASRELELRVVLRHCFALCR